LLEKWLQKELDHARDLLQELFSAQPGSLPESVERLSDTLDRIEFGCYEMGLRMAEKDDLLAAFEAARERRRRSRAVYEDLFAEAPIGYAVFDTERRLEFANETARLQLGLESLPQDREPETRQAPELPPVLVQQVEEALSSELPRAWRFEVRSPEGPRRLLAYSVPMESPEGDRLVRCLLVDLVRLNTMELRGDRVWSQKISTEAESVLGVAATATVDMATGEMGFSPGESRPAGEGGKVLLAEDEEGLRELCRQKLEEMGLSVVACQDGAVALDTFLQEPRGFRLVVTDQKMPTLKGSELIKSIRQANQEVPILLYTGFLDEYTGEEVAACGASRVLLKPLPMADFRGVVASMLQLQANGPKE
jgi:CheY-like chemotaxis protein/PAS domain-containing protein